MILSHRIELNATFSQREYFARCIANDRLRLEGETVVLPKIGRVRLTETLRFTGKIMGAVVSRTADRWFIAIQVDVGDYRKQRVFDGVVGVDLGLLSTATVSNGQSFQSPKPLKSHLKRLRRLSNRHARKQRGSKNKAKSACKLARLHSRIANIRQDFLHKMTTTLASENQAVCVEDLYVQNMQQNRRLSRPISDQGWREMRRQLNYKLPIYGGRLVVIDRWYPSSKTCRKCGQIKCDLKLSNRTFLCDGCGHEEDRDLNAAHNIRTAGLAEAYACGPEGSGSTRKSRVKPCRDEAGTKTCSLSSTN